MASVVVEEFMPIPLATLHPSSVTGFRLYIRDNPDHPARLYRDASIPFEADDLQRLIASGTTCLFISTDDREAYQEYLRANYDVIVRDEALPISRRFGCLNAVVRDVLAQAFAQGDTQKTVDAARELGAETVELICRDEIVADELMQVLCHDYHTFTHSANVSYYAVLLAKGLGITDRDELEQIATGALLHDLGKLKIAEKVLTKPDRLSDREREIIERHPTLGFLELADRMDLTNAQLMMVYQHHEKLDGSGYPVGVSGDEIHPFAQLCAVVDIYEALTSLRPYRRALPASETKTIIDRQAGSKLNQEMWQCWQTIIQTT